MQYGQGRVQRRQLEQDRAAQRAWEMEKAQIQALGGLSEKIAADPSSAAMLLQGAQMNPLFSGLDLSRMKPADPAVIAALRSKVGKIDNTADLPNPEDIAAQAGLDTTPVAPATDGQGSQFGFMAPSSTFEGTNPSVQPVQQAVNNRRDALRQQSEDKIATAGRTKQAESYGTATGTNTAENENAPIALQNKVKETQTLAPVEAAAAGLKTGAEIDAKNDPTRQRATARGAGMTAGAEAQARESARVAAEKAIRASGLSPQQQQAALQLGDDFRQWATTFKVKEESFRTILSAAKNPSPAGDLSLIFGYMRMLDPGSTVREGEFANAQNSAGVPEQVRQQYNKALSGQRLTPDMRNDFVAQAFANYSGAKQGHDRLIQDYTSRALQMGVNPSLVVRQTDPELDKSPSVAKGSALDKLLNNGAR